MSKPFKTALAVAALCASGSAFADSVQYDLNTVANGAAPGASAHLTISDFAAGVVQVTLQASLQGIQTITGLWLDTSNLASVSLASSPSATGPAAPSLGGYSATQTQVPKTKDTTGAYNLWLSFPNNGATVLQGSAVETFYLTGTGLTAAMFKALAGQTAGGNPTSDFYAMMGLTNSGGTAGSGTAYVGSTSPVPLPAALPLLVAGLGGLGGFLRRRRTV